MGLLRATLAFSLFFTILVVVVGNLYLLYKVRPAQWSLEEVSHDVGHDSEGTVNKTGHLCMSQPNWCSDVACTMHLTENDKKVYEECIRQLQGYIGDGISIQDSGCRFMPTSSHHQPVALISFPGSGNTWVRQLLEAASGICTGSTMCDMSLRFAGFTGENIQSGRVLVVKTHASEPNWITTTTQEMSGLDHRSGSSFNSAIILIRNPMDAMVSEWNRRAANNFKSKTVHLNTHRKQTKLSNFSKFCVDLYT